MLKTLLIACGLLAASLSAQAADISQPEPVAVTIQQAALDTAETVFNFVVPSANAASLVPAGVLTAAQTDIEDTTTEITEWGFGIMVFVTLAFAVIGLSRRAFGKGGVK